MLTICKVPAVDELGEPLHKAQHQFECRTCPYQYKLERTHYEPTHFKRKKAAEIMGGADSLAKMEKTEVRCKEDACKGTQAAVYQVQIRSADEPMTTFFTCTTCLKRWQEN